MSAFCYSMRGVLASAKGALLSQGSPYLLFLVSYTPLAWLRRDVASCSDFARPIRARSGLAELRGVRAGPSVQNHHLAGFNGASNNIKSLKGCKATTSNYSGATQLTQQHNLQVKLATSNISGTQVPEEPSSRRHIQVPSSLMAIYEHKLTTVEHKQLHSQLDNF